MVLGTTPKGFPVHALLVSLVWLALHSLTPTERSLRSRKAAAARWARPGARQAQAEKIRATRLAHHERLVDPALELDPVERRRLARQSLKAEMLGLALKSAKARRLKKAS